MRSSTGSLPGAAGRGWGDRPGRAGQCGDAVAAGRAGPAGNGWPGRLNAVCVGHPDQGCPPRLRGGGPGGGRIGLHQGHRPAGRWPPGHLRHHRPDWGAVPGWPAGQPGRNEQPGLPPSYLIQDLERGRPMLILVALFVGAVVAFGRWQGIRSLVGLGLSFVIIVGFVVPAILRGHSPVAVAVTGAMAIMLVSLYLSHGTGPKTTAAVVGTALALGLTAALSIVFVAATSLTGLASEEAQFASFAVGGLSLRGLLLAGIIIGGLGVLDDVTMSQASLVTELHQANPTAGMAALVAGALRVGRDHIAATVNTLFLAYAGAALPSLILFVTGQNSLEFTDIDQPTPTDNQVLVKVQAAGVHRGDWHIMTGLPYMIRLVVPRPDPV